MGFLLPPGDFIDLIADPIPTPSPPSSSEIERVLAGRSTLTGESIDFVDDYNASCTWGAMLATDGWQLSHTDRDHVGHWVRPGKEAREGTSATVGFGGHDILYVYTTSIPWLPSERAYDKYGYMVHRDHGGDFRVAGRALGTQPRQKATTTTVPKPPAPMGDGGLPDDGRRISLTSAASIDILPTYWLWEDRIPLGELTLIAGREDLGKSTVAFTLAAWITTGTMRGDSFGQQRNVLVAASEDDWGRTIVPRLTAAGADVITDDGIEGSLDFPHDVLRLEAAAIESKAAMLILDPITSRLAASLDTHKDADVRRALEPLVALAHRTGMTLLGLIHVNKGADKDVLNSIMASRAFSAVPRSVLFVMRDPDDAEGRTRCFGNAKNNLGPSGLKTYRFQIVGKLVGERNGVEIWTGSVEWDTSTVRDIREIAGDAAEAANGNQQDATDATSWLDAYLSVGPKASGIIKRAAHDAGHSDSALARARKKIGVKVDYDSTGSSMVTIWRLPNIEEVRCS
jgi:hypothetical protein